jgi:hypothetical protein
MISSCIKLGLISLIAAGLVGCGSSSSGSVSDGTRVDISAAASPAISAIQSAGAKTFNNDLGDSITITRAYLVLSSATIEADCGITFTASLEHLLSFLISNATAHTTTTPTSTGEPYVINLLATDDAPIAIGKLSPPVNNYCGIRIDMLAADADTFSLPTGAGEPDMIGKSIYIEGNFTLAGGGSGDLHLSSGAALVNRDLMLSPLLLVSGDNPSGRIDISINYDTWFSAVDMALLETETATFTNPGDLNVSRVLQNITESIHQR